MVIDPVSVLAFEAEREEDGAICRPPQSVDEPLLFWPTAVWSLVQGPMALGAAGSAAWFAPGCGLDPDQVFRPNKALDAVLPGESGDGL